MRIFLLAVFMGFGWVGSLQATLISIYVPQGSSLIEITRKYCTSEYHWKELAKINELENADYLRSGTTLFVPLDLLKKQVLFATVASVSGGVYLLENGNSLLPVTKGQSILPGQILVTENDGFAHLVYPDHKYTRVSSNSKFSLKYLVRLIDDSLKAEFYVEKGRITHSVKKKLKKNESYITRTPVSVTGVRGTEFRIKVSEENENIVETMAGEVLVEASGKSIKVAAGEGAKVEKGQTSLLARTLPQIPSFDDIKPLYKKLPVSIATPISQDVYKYGMRITSKENNQNTILERSVDAGTNFLLVSLEDGLYGAEFTAISSDGFESLPTVPHFFQIRTSPAPPIFSQYYQGKDVYDDEVMVQWLESEGAGKYRIQLAKDADFNELILEKDLNAARFRSGTLSTGTYYFRIQSLSDDGYISPYSVVDWWVVRKTPGLDRIEANGEKGLSLTWDSMGEGVDYEIQISSDKEFKNIVVAEYVQDMTELLVSKFEGYGDYYVQLRACFQDGQKSPWSKRQILKIPAPPIEWLKLALVTFLPFLILL